MELPVGSSEAASRGGVAQALEAARSERRLGAHASHAGAPALIGLETRRSSTAAVKLEEPLAAGAPPTEESGGACAAATTPGAV